MANLSGGGRNHDQRRLRMSIGKQRLLSVLVMLAGGSGLWASHDPTGTLLGFVSSIAWTLGGVHLLLTFTNQWFTKRW